MLDVCDLLPSFRADVASLHIVVDLVDVFLAELVQIYPRDHPDLHVKRATWKYLITLDLSLHLDSEFGQ